MSRVFCGQREADAIVSMTILKDNKPECYGGSASSQPLNQTTVEALVSGHPREAKKVSVTGAGRLREWFSYAATSDVGERWPLTGACPANNKCNPVLKYKTIPPY